KKKKETTSTDSEVQKKGNKRRTKENQYITTTKNATGYQSAVSAETDTHVDTCQVHHAVCSVTLETASQDSVVAKHARRQSL
ncbi:hypothetical protein CSC81_17485, partial [Tenacibaculum discolor]